ncbi:unnamed protein product [Tenebrio molitor]|nr:unnamed protein product [Tenebrio molitor]
MHHAFIYYTTLWLEMINHVINNGFLSMDHYKIFFLSNFGMLTSPLPTNSVHTK